jgi:hypothetical protein
MKTKYEDELRKERESNVRSTISMKKTNNLIALITMSKIL